MSDVCFFVKSRKGGEVGWVIGVKVLAAGINYRRGFLEVGISDLDDAPKTTPRQHCGLFQAPIHNQKMLER
jgi:hypothetical protein